jgi:hypothetical protein
MSSNRDKILNDIIYWIVGQGLSNKEVAEKFFDGEVKKVDNEIVKLRKLLTAEYRRRAILEDGEFPSFDKLSPLHQDFVRFAFHLRAYLGAERLIELDARGADAYARHLRRPLTKYHCSQRTRASRLLVT